MLVVLPMCHRPASIWLDGISFYWFDTHHADWSWHVLPAVWFTSSDSLTMEATDKKPLPIKRTIWICGVKMTFIPGYNCTRCWSWIALYRIYIDFGMYAMANIPPQRNAPMNLLILTEESKTLLIFHSLARTAPTTFAESSMNIFP